MQLITHFAEKGIHLFTEEGKLKFRSAKGPLNQEDKELLKQHKEEIIAYLESQKKSNSEGFPLTPIQKSYFVGRDEAYDLGGINTHYYMELESDNSLNVEKLERAWNQVIQKNDALRLVILSNGNQKVLENAPEYKIQEFTFSSSSEHEQCRNQWSHHIYPLNEWPFFTLRVSHDINGKDYIHFDFDCMIMDAWSAKIALQQTMQIYNNQEVKFPSYSFKEYCNSVRDYEAKQDFSAAENFWKAKAKELVCEPKLPYAKPLSQIQNHRFARLSGQLDAESYLKLQVKAREYRTTPACAISTAYLRTLLKYSQDEALTINSTVFNRLPLSPEINDVVGDFTNIAFINLTKKEQNFFSSIQAVQKDMWQLIRYHSYDGTKILKWKEGLQPMRAQMPIVITCVLDGGKNKNSMPGVHQVYALSKTPQVVLDYQVTDFDGNLSVNWDYAVPAFDTDVLNRMFNDNLNLLKQLIEKDWKEIV